MQLTIFNGSPRVKGSGSRYLVEAFAKGFTDNGENTCSQHYLATVKNMQECVQVFTNAEMVFVIFPLYTNAMPGAVKELFEALAPLCEREQNPPIFFMVHSGFPEALHSRKVEKYLKKLASRLNSPYLGTIVKGGSEGIASEGPEGFQDLMNQMESLGKYLSENGSLSEEMIEKIAKPEKFPLLFSLAFKPLLGLPFFNSHWNNQMKRNNVYNNRNARPYLDS